MVRIAGIICIAVVVAFAAGHARADEKVVRLATLTDFPPYCYEKPEAPHLVSETIRPGDDSVQLQGYSWDVVRRSFHAMGYTIELYVVPWARVLYYLESGKVDAIFPANRTVEREKIYQFSKEYVDRTRIVVYVGADASMTWNDIRSLEGLRVGFVRGWAYGKKWENSDWVQKEATDTILQSFLLLEKGRLDAVVGYELAYDFVLMEHNITQRYHKLGSFDVIDEYLIAHKEKERAARFLEAFDSGHNYLESSGILGVMEEAWQEVVP